MNFHGRALNLSKWGRLASAIRQRRLATGAQDAILPYVTCQ
jgi:hypothetical protein